MGDSLFFSWTAIWTVVTWLRTGWIWPSSRSGRFQDYPLAWEPPGMMQE
jgi:hypothetical protein